MRPIGILLVLEKDAKKVDDRDKNSSCSYKQLGGRKAIACQEKKKMTKIERNMRGKNKEERNSVEWKQRWTKAAAFPVVNTTACKCILLKHEFHDV